MGEIDRRHAVLAAEHRRDLFILHHPQLDERDPQFAAIGFLVIQRLLQLGWRDALLSKKEFPDTNGHGC